MDIVQTCLGDKGYYQKNWHSTITPANFAPYH
jgi:hypothetical protein